MNPALSILFNAFWCGLAALGFGLLFNAPGRALRFIFLGGALAGLVKFGLLLAGAGIISGSFAAAVAVGLASIPVAHRSHVPPVIFSIPSVIPLVPGAFAYRTMLGIMQLAGPVGEGYAQTLQDTFRYGTLTLFVIMAISFGVAVPMHVLRQSSAKNLRLQRPGKQG